MIIDVHHIKKLSIRYFNYMPFKILINTYRISMFITLTNKFKPKNPDGFELFFFKIKGKNFNFDKIPMNHHHP